MQRSGMRGKGSMRGANSRITLRSIRATATASGYADCHGREKRGLAMTDAGRVSLQKNLFDTAVRNVVNKIFLPVSAEQAVGEFYDDVIGLKAGVLAIA